jgi:hypothetical protein
VGIFERDGVPRNGLHAVAGVRGGRAAAAVRGGVVAVSDNRDEGIMVTGAPKEELCQELCARSANADIRGYVLFILI